MEVPIAIIRFLISWLPNILSRRACSVLRILPLNGKIAWNSLSLHCFAEPPAESHSTMYSSDFEGSLEEQSASLPGRVIHSSAHLRITVSLAFLAASLARDASSDFSIISFADFGFSSKNSLSFSHINLSTIHLTSLLPSFDFVCHSNCGSGTFMLITAVIHSTTSSFVRLMSFSFRISFALAYLLMVLVSAVRNQTR